MLEQESLKESLIVDLTALHRKILQQFLLSRFVQTQDVDAADVKLLALIEVDIKGDPLGFLVELCIRDRGKVDVAQLSVDFTEIL